jgi:hypothetical protein
MDLLLTARELLLPLRILRYLIEKESSKRSRGLNQEIIEAVLEVTSKIRSLIRMSISFRLMNRF